MHPSLHIYDPSVKEFINVDFEIQTLTSECVFTEGPVWNENGFYLFSDIPANTIYKIIPGEEKEVFLANSGIDNLNDHDLRIDQIGSNGLTYNKEGNLIICQHGNHRIANWNGTSLQPLVDKNNGRPFNSPNDLIYHSNGTLYFSDPPYGLKDSQLNKEKFQPIAGVYFLRDGEVHLLSDKYDYPNGVCLSPDEKILYICSNKEAEKFISSYDTQTHEFLGIIAHENSDGLKCDPSGNFYLSNEAGILILNIKGERLAVIKFPSIPANHCWGGRDKKDLFVTARENVFLIRNLLK